MFVISCLFYLIDLLFIVLFSLIIVISIGIQKVYEVIKNAVKKVISF